MGPKLLMVFGGMCFNGLNIVNMLVLTTQNGRVGGLNPLDVPIRIRSFSGGI